MQIEYKLIPYPNQEGEWLIISNEEIKIANFVLIVDKYINVARKLHTFDGLQVDYDPEIEFTTVAKTQCKKIIASTILIKNAFLVAGLIADISIPLIRKEQLIFADEIDIDNIATIYTNKEVGKRSIRQNSNARFDENYEEWDLCHNSFMDGYNKHAKTHPFTLDDVRLICSRFAHQCRLKGVNTNKDTVELMDEFLPLFIQSLQQPKKEYIVELEMEEIPENYQPYTRHELSTDIVPCNFILIPKVDKEGYVNIISIKH